MVPASRSAEAWADREGCLIIPSLSGVVERPVSITIEYLNLQMEPQSRVFSGFTAKMIQHEYDHIEGQLYLDHLKPFERSLLRIN